MNSRLRPEVLAPRNVDFVPLEALGSQATTTRISLRARSSVVSGGIITPVRRTGHDYLSVITRGGTDVRGYDHYISRAIIRTTKSERRILHRAIATR